jgi:predicted ATP-dependent protease
MIMHTTSLKLLLIPMFALLMQSCTTLDDFKKMTPQSRAQKACNADPTVQHHSNLVNNYTHKLNNISTLLNQGYKTVESCSTTTTKIPAINKKTQKHYYKSVFQETCHRDIVPLTEYATSRLLQQQQDLLPKLTYEKNAMDETFLTCFEKVVTFTPERAFKYYEN